MSGGPLLNSDNAVVGIVHKGGPNEGRNFAIHIEELDACLLDWGPVERKPKTDTKPPKSPESLPNSFEKPARPAQPAP
jgi:hypothetical protein